MAYMSWYQAIELALRIPLSATWRWGQQKGTAQHFCSLWQYMLFKIQHTFIFCKPLSANQPHQTFRFEVNHVSEKMHTMGHLCAVLFKRARVWRRECSKECSGNWVECKVHKELKMRFVWKDGLWRIWVTARFIGCGCTRELRKH